jgi:Fic family protein
MSAVMNKEKYISVEEAAKKWGKTARNVRLRCQKGHVPGATIEGRSWLIPADAVDPGQSTRRKVRAKSIWEVLKAEKRSGTKNGIYHRLQIDFAYNSNHMEGSRLTHEQTRWIFETKTIGSLGEDTPVDDVVETANHFRCLDIVIETAGAALTESYIKRLHAQLKSGTSDSRKAWFAVGEYKRLDNVVGEMETCPAKDIPREMAKLLAWWKGADKTLANLLDLHVRFEQIHPFQDGNGRVGRLILLKECLKYNITPFIIADDMRKFYYLGLQEWRQGRRARLLDTCRAAQDIFIAGLRKFGHTKIAEKALAEQAKSEGEMKEVRSE